MTDMSDEEWLDYIQAKGSATRAQLDFLIALARRSLAPLPAPGEGRVNVTGPIIGEDGYLKPKSEWPNPEEAMPGPNYVRKWGQETGTPFFKAPGEGRDYPLGPPEWPDLYAPTPPKKDTVGELIELLENCAKAQAEYNPLTPRHYEDHLTWHAATALKQMQERAETCERFELRHRKQIDVLIGENRIRDIAIAAKDAEIKQMQEELEATESTANRWMSHHKDRERENADLHATITALQEERGAFHDVAELARQRDAAKDAEIEAWKAKCEKVWAAGDKPFAEATIANIRLIEAQATIARLREALEKIAEMHIAMPVDELKAQADDAYDVARADLQE
jgi:hypothetical protein